MISQNTAVTISMTVELIIIIYFLNKINIKFMSKSAIITMILTSISMIMNQLIIVFEIREVLLIKDFLSIIVMILIVIYIFLLNNRNSIKDMSLISLFISGLIIINTFIINEWMLFYRTIDNSIYIFVMIQVIKIIYGVLMSRCLILIDYITELAAIISLIICITIKLIISISIISNNYNDIVISTLTVIILLLIFIIYVLLILVLNLYSRFIDKKLINKNIVEKKDSFKYYQMSINNIFEEIRIWDHDLKNHMSVMISLLESKSEEELRRYIKNMNKEVNDIVRIIHTKNIVLDSILNYKLNYANKNGIRLNINTNLNNKIQILDLDIVALVSNLLDNSIEACEYVKLDKWITINIYTRKKNIILEVINSTDGYKCSGNLKTRKGTVYNGIGISQIDRIVKKYNGIVKREHKDNVFKTYIVMNNR